MISRSLKIANGSCGSVTMATAEEAPEWLFVFDMFGREVRPKERGIAFILQHRHVKRESVIVAYCG